MEKDNSRPLSNFPFVNNQNPIKYKTLEEKRITKLENELKSVKNDYIKLESQKEEQISKLENDLQTLKLEYAQLKSEDLKNLKTENEELNKINIHLM